MKKTPFERMMSQTAAELAEVSHAARKRADSTLVRGYVKAVRRHLDLKARLTAHDERLRPLRNKVAVAAEQVKRKYGRLNGGQIAAAERLLREGSTPIKEKEAV